MATTVTSSTAAATPNPNNNSRILTSHHQPKRPPLLPSDTVATTQQRRPKSREVTSRYLSTPSSATSSYSSLVRSPSPVVRTAPNTPIITPSLPVTGSVAGNRSRSVDRRQPQMSTAERLLVGNGSKRSLCVSFQGETMGVPISKTKLAPTPVVERRRDENTRPSDSRRWPGMRSIDCGGGMEKKTGGRHVARALKLQQSVDEILLSSVSGSTTASDLPSSDSESVTSRRPRAIAVPARFWQETTNRLRKLPEQNPMKKSFSESNPASSPPSKVLSTLSPVRRGKLSPSRLDNGFGSTMNDGIINTPSILSFDARRGKVGENKNADIHELRMFYNRHLQWRLANARAVSAMQAQRDMAEKSLCNVWEKTLELRHSVNSKRLEVQQLRQKLKLYSLLNGQMPFLDDWEVFDGDYLRCLEGAVESLEASTIRLPLVGGAKANIQEVKDSISSAVDVMHGIGSSLCGLLEKVVQTNSLASEVASISINERVSLEQCRDLLSTVTAMQVEDCSLRTQMLQLACV